MWLSQRPSDAFARGVRTLLGVEGCERFMFVCRLLCMMVCSVHVAISWPCCKAQRNYIRHIFSQSQWARTSTFECTFHWMKRASCD